MILQGDSAEILKDFNDNCIDLTVTSPPYDNLRTYGGFTFNFEAIAKQLYRVTKQGGIVVWIVGDATVDSSETTTSAEQKIYFRKTGFKIHDTMIYAKKGFTIPSNNRYHQNFEYMFILVKGSIKTFNPIIDQISIKTNIDENIKVRQTDGTFKSKTKSYNPFHMRYNVWNYGTGFNVSTKDEIAFNHPAIFPEQLAIDHIKSWSNEGDLILDPFAGSGTTLKAAHQLNRKWIGIEINPDYVQLAKKRLTPYIQQQRMEKFLNI